MNAYDRIMALTRLPEYLKEYEEYLSAFDKSLEKAEALAVEIGEKWGEYPPPRPLPPYVDVYSDLFKGGYSDRHIQIVEEITDKDPPLRVDWASLVRIAHDPDFIPEKPALSGKHIYIKVDLTAKKTDLEEEFKKLIDSHKKFVPQKRGRDKETQYSPWLVYDMRHRDGLNLSQIAQKLSGIKDNPSYNDKLMAHYKCVKRAYDKAKEMIMEVGLRAKPRRKT